MPDNTETNEQGVINVGGRIVASYVDMTQPITPTEGDYIFIVRVETDGSKKYGRYTVDQLIEALGADVTAVKTAIETLYAEIQPTLNLVEEWAPQIAQDIQEWETMVSQSKQELEDATDASVSEIGSSKDSALSEIGTAKTDALSEIGTLKESALSDIEDQKDAAIEELKGNLHVGYSTTIGDGTTTDFTITHNLGSEWTIPFVLFADPEKAYYHKYFDVDQNTARIVFDFPPDSDGVEVRILPNVRVEVADLPATMTISRNNLDEDTECTAEDVQELIAILD